VEKLLVMSDGEVKMLSLELLLDKIEELLYEICPRQVTSGAGLQNTVTLS
jgi:hypothetical protein